MNSNNQNQDWGTPSSPVHWSLKAGPLINEQNKGVYLTVVWMLGSIGVVSVIGILGLACYAKEIPQALIALGSVAIGALGSLFTHSK